MNRKLLRSVREYKRESFLTPVLVCLEVLMEIGRASCRERV